MRKWRSDRGMNTVEYAIVGLAAATLAGGLLAIVSSDSVKSALAGVILRALSSS
ncbi:DUF4244 domain-containing protein [Allorhizocola rhizosphaerae]|uniref:DUF4244 domain-containing protein n=1 Tax=Allorhizocola rhizosphaerae TaxID=1872709 RepID=UPI003CCC7000